MPGNVWLITLHIFLLIAITFSWVGCSLHMHVSPVFQSVMTRYCHQSSHGEAEFFEVILAKH